MPVRTAALTLLAGLALACRAGPAEDAYADLAKRYDDALAAYQKAFAAAKTDADRARVMRDDHPPVGDYAKRFLALARKNPRTVGAVDALVWVAVHPLDPARDEAALRAEALALLAKDHADDDKAGSLCTRLAHALDEPSETFLRAVRDGAKKKPVLARATASLAVNLRHRARLAPALAKDADARKQYEAALGKDAVAALARRDAGKLAAESEKLFTETIKSFGDLPHPTHGDLGSFAQRHLLALRYPVRADAVAPPVVGKDLDGKALSLAEFRGHVVLMDFWGDAFAPCRARYGYERELTARLAKKPFVLLGVNGDFDRKSARATADKEKMTWRSFFDGGTGGPIATRFDVELWPTLALIDHKGVVRHVFVGWPEPKALDALIDGLVLEATRSP